MIEFEDVKSGREEERSLTDTEMQSFHYHMSEQGKRHDWTDVTTSRVVDIGDVFDEVSYQGITSVNALVVEGTKEFRELPLDDVKRIIERIYAARELLRKRGYLEAEYPNNSEFYAYAFARRTPKEELAQELEYLLNRFAAELEASLNSAKDPV